MFDPRADPATGLLHAERTIMESLVDAVNGFARLPVQHSMDYDDFVRAIHVCQDLLAVRIVRRMYPRGWRNEEAKGSRDAS